MSNANIETELNHLLVMVTEEIKADNHEIDIRKKRVESNTKLATALKARIAGLHPENTTNGYGSKLDMIQAAISRLPNLRFTQDDVEAELERTNPEMERNRNRIRASIWTICERHKAIRLISKGTNRSPAQFEKIKPGASIIRTRRMTEKDKEQTLHNAAASNGSLEAKAVE